MNRLFIAMILACVTFVCTTNAEAASSTTSSKKLSVQNNLSVVINGKPITFNAPILNNSGSLMLPMKSFFDALNAQVSWNQQTKTVSTVKNGNTIHLTMNSTLATVNGTEVKINAAPIVYQSRSYVPLRFFSENLKGTVSWKQQQQVDITINETAPEKNPSTPETDPVASENPTTPVIPATPDFKYLLYIGNYKTVMDEPIINSQGRMYIPAKYFQNYIEGSSSQWLSENDLELQLAGLTFVFSNGSNIANVAGEPITMQEKPFIVNKQMYVPVHFIVNTLKDGGNIRYISEQHALYIYLNQHMFTGKLLDKSYGSMIVPTLVQNATLKGNQEIIISDNPETLTNNVIPTTEATLSAYTVSPTSSIKNYRVFGWHYNDLGQNAKIAITVQNTSASESLEVTNSKGASRISGNSWISYDIGIPLADAVLNNKLKRSANDKVVIPPLGTAIIESYDLDVGNLIGFLHDFSIRPVNGQTVDYTIRTVITRTNADLTTIHTDPVPVDLIAAHPRGAWPSSTINVTLPTYTVDAPEAGYNLSNGKTDHLLTASNSLVTLNGAIGNPGHFGMMYEVNIPIQNPTGENKKVKISFAGRGGLYNGVVRMNGNVYIIPTLKPSLEYVELPSYEVTGQTDTINLEIIHAGGSNLPLAVYVKSE